MQVTEHPFIQSIAEDQREGILSKISRRSFADGEAIFPEGSKPDALCLILEGTILFVKDRADGSVQTVSASREGEFFGEIGIMTGAERALGARAAGPVTVAEIPREAVQDLIHNAPGPVNKIMESVIHHLQGTTNHYINEVVRTEKLALVGTMISSILHDFKNPFALISLGAHLVQKRHADEPKTVKICNNIEAQIRRMVDMADDLSAFSRGGSEIEFGHIDLPRFFEAFKELNAPFFENPGIELELEIAPSAIQGDQSKLLRVLQNLLSNAIDAIKASGKPGKIKVTAEDDANCAVIKVSDNGPGIPQEIRETFFEPFVTHGKSNGTGLGSAIAKSIVEAHKGTIRFDTGAEGTAFTIRLPKKQEKATRPPM